ncbi:ribose-phosphate pyrophosphokinase [Fontibacillus solani]|uniref:ribose-phosphate diphosphokinase n=1 Tax=Fontibacillus solani TaxID=1572857 RepID=A0A7W3XT36_9BACL|nr:ribose-phosphate diphosphokinase [Fontibacillus solani]MBA9087200.1 ribose-phosphate pyrophosphokinase [Fontibacillus solani]
MHKVWLGPSASHYEGALSRYPEIKLVDSSIRYFPDGESCIKLEEDVRNEDVIVLQNTAPPQDLNLRHLYQMVDVLRHNRARTITCIVPYLAYSRQDRRTHSGEPFSAEIVIRTLAMLGADTLATVELHNPKMDISTTMKLVNLSTDNLFVKWINHLTLERPVLVAPDKGSHKRIQKIAQIVDIPCVCLEKYKKADGETWYEENGELDLHSRHAIIIDDLCSSGSTLIPLCKYLTDIGIVSVNYGVTHFFANSFQLKQKIGADLKIYCTDTVPTDDSNISIEQLLFSFITKEWRIIS